MSKAPFRVERRAKGAVWLTLDRPEIHNGRGQFGLVTPQELYQQIVRRSARAFRDPGHDGQRGSHRRSRQSS